MKLINNLQVESYKIQDLENDDILHQSFHQEKNKTIWREMCPCLHPGKKCPFKKCCGFPTIGEAMENYNAGETGIVENVLLEFSLYIEIDVKMIKSRRSKEPLPKTLNLKVMNLPLDRYLKQYGLPPLKREYCKNKICKSGNNNEECGKAHRLNSLFTQFYNPFIMEYYSHHLQRKVEPTLEKGVSFTTKECLYCQLNCFFLLPLVVTHSLTSELLVAPIVSLQCLHCRNTNGFLIYK